MGEEGSLRVDVAGEVEGLSLVVTDSTDEIYGIEVASCLKEGPLILLG